MPAYIECCSVEDWRFLIERARGTSVELWLRPGVAGGLTPLADEEFRHSRVLGLGLVCKADLLCGMLGLSTTERRIVGTSFASDRLYF